MRRPVGPTFNEFVPLFQGNGTAPIARERPARPDCQREPEEAEDNPYESRHLRIGEDTTTQRVRQVGEEKKQQSRNRHESVPHGAGHALPLRGRLVPPDVSHPVEIEYQPARDDEPFRTSWSYCWDENSRLSLLFSAFRGTKKTKVKVPSLKRRSYSGSRGMAGPRILPGFRRNQPACRMSHRALSCMSGLAVNGFHTSPRNPGPK